MPLTLYASMKKSLDRYESLIERLVTEIEGGQGGGAADPAEQRVIEADLRKYGAQLVDDAQEIIDRERSAMQLNTEVLLEDFASLGDKEKIEMLEEISTQVTRASSPAP